MSDNAPIAYQAPGKVVIWGEYAVLAGAPAGVMAIDRYATVRLHRSDHGINYCAQGLLTANVHQACDKFIDVEITRLAEAILQHWGFSAWPAGAMIEMDTQSFYQNGKKYGLGSSAALCVALYNALAERLEHKPDISEAMAIHRAFQGGKGSGLDIAASWYGSTILFTDGHAAPFKWPAELYWQLIWTGHSASTSAHLKDFSTWRDGADTSVLDDLVQHSKRVAQAPGIDTLHQYVAILREFDVQTQLNIFTHEHALLATIAARTQVVYKPCGAGGGDIGIAISQDRQALAHFADQATHRDFVVLQSEIASNGIEHCA